MALEGNLSEFGLAAIFQLIAVQQKTGMLTIIHDQRTTVLFFKNGYIISTRDRRQRVADPLKDYITRYGILQRSDLDKIAQITSDSKLDLADVLSSEDFIPKDELERHFLNLVQETLHEVLSWEQCSYKFTSNHNIVGGVRQLGEYNVESMLMESMRRIDDFPRILKMFPSDEMVITRVDDGDTEKKLTTNEKTVLGKLTAVLTIRQLIATAKLPTFDVYEALKNLRDKSLVKVEDTRPPQNLPENELDIAHNPRRSILSPAPFLIAVLLFASAGGVGWKISGQSIVNDLRTHSASSDVSTPEARRQARTRVMERIRWTLDAYRAAYGGYPARLEALEKAGLANKGLIDRAASFDIEYQLTKSNRAFILL